MLNFSARPYGRGRPSKSLWGLMFAQAGEDAPRNGESDLVPFRIAPGPAPVAVPGRNETKTCICRAGKVSLGLLGQLNDYEVLLGIKIVFARLIYDTQLAVPLGILIRDASVKLPQLQ